MRYISTDDRTLWCINVVYDQRLIPCDYSLLFPGLECASVPDYSVELGPMLTPDVEPGDSVTLTCSTTLPGATFPDWEINAVVFPVTHLPLAFTANGTSIQYVFEGDVDIRCVFSEGSVVNICSNDARVTGVEGARG